MFGEPISRANSSHSSIARSDQDRADRAVSVPERGGQHAELHRPGSEVSDGHGSTLI
jgi:hypothetical protein